MKGALVEKFYFSVIFLEWFSFIIPCTKYVITYRGIVHVGRFYRVVFGKSKESLKLKVIYCSSGVSDERDEGQRCARRCGVKWILEIVVERQKGKVSIYENVEAHESDRTTSGHREEEERSFVVQKLAWYTEALIDRFERGKKIGLMFNYRLIIK